MVKIMKLVFKIVFLPPSGLTTRLLRQPSVLQTFSMEKLLKIIFHIPLKLFTGHGKSQACGADQLLLIYCQEH